MSNRIFVHDLPSAARLAQLYPQPRLTRQARTLRYLRQMAGLTQAQLAAQAGVSESAISAAESGLVIPRDETLDKLAAGLGVEVEQLEGV